jgi:hypothetical protein
MVRAGVEISHRVDWIALNGTTAVGKSSGLDVLVSITAHSASLIALRATAAAPTPSTTGGSIRIVAIASLSPLANGDWDALQDSAVVMASRVHSVVEGEISAYQIRAHSSVLLSHFLRVADGVRLIFAIVDAHNTGVACRRRVGFVQGIRPAATAAETCNPLAQLSLHHGTTTLKLMASVSFIKSRSCCGPWMDPAEPNK